MLYAFLKTLTVIIVLLSAFALFASSIGGVFLILKNVRLGRHLIVLAHFIHFFYATAVLIFYKTDTDSILPALQFIIRKQATFAYLALSAIGLYYFYLAIKSKSERKIYYSFFALNCLLIFNIYFFPYNMFL